MSRMTMRRKASRKGPAAKMAPVAADARDSAIRYAESTRDWAAPKVEAAREWAAPHVEPVTSRVREDVLPKVAGAVTAALAASEPVRDEARTRGTAAIAALRGELEPPKPKKHRLRKLVLLAGVIGAAVAGWKAWVGQQNRQPEPWATTPIRPAGGTGTSGGTSGGAGSTSGAAGASGAGLASSGTAAPGPATDDVAGASPDEALADAAEEQSVSEERTNPGSPAGDTAAAKTTEKVPAKAAKKTAKAEGEAGRSSTTRKSTS